MGLNNIEKRYKLLNRSGKEINIDEKKIINQYGVQHKIGSLDLTSIILLSAERFENTKECIKSIFENTKEPYEIIVVDDNSSEQTKDLLFELQNIYKNIHIIYNDEIRGTTSTRNQGIYLSSGGLICLLDNDVIVLNDWLKYLRGTILKDYNIGLVGAKLLKDDAEYVYYCGIHPIALAKEENIYGIGLDKEKEKANIRKDDKLAEIAGEIPWYPTTCLLTKRDIIFEVDGFDNDGLTIANEDKDLCLKVRKNKYKIFYCPESVVIHNHNYQKVDRSDKYHSTYRLRMNIIEKDVKYFMKKWKLKYIIEKLPHEDNTKIFDGEELKPVKLDFLSSPFKEDLIRISGS